MSQNEVGRYKVWCPLCEKKVDVVRVNTAAKMGGMNNRTIYRHIENGSLHTIRVAGKSLRVCSGCVAKMTAHQSRGIVFRDNNAWCLKCNEKVELLSVFSAAKSADVSRTTIYRYIREEAVSTFKLFGRRVQVCAECLLKHDTDG